MCEDCKYALKDRKGLICMGENLESQYEYMPKNYVCDEYEPKEDE